MAKPEKKKSKKDRGKAAGRTKPRGRLVALDGTNGVMLRSEAERLARLCCGTADPAWSLWDASNTFYELRMVKAKNLTPTPRVLMLLYASDLLFRLRWEIEPTLKEGRTVVAAPYVESAMAFGVAAGLPKEWI
jgi:thymidylate kinase